MSNAPERIYLGVEPTDDSYGFAYNKPMKWGVKSTTEYIRRDAITSAMAAQVLLGKIDELEAMEVCDYDERGEAIWESVGFNGGIRKAVEFFRDIATQKEKLND